MRGMVSEPQYLFQTGQQGRAEHCNEQVFALGRFDGEACTGLHCLTCLHYHQIIQLQQDGVFKESVRQSLLLWQACERHVSQSPCKLGLFITSREPCAGCTASGTLDHHPGLLQFVALFSSGPIYMPGTSAS
jgi:hypothetical protein